MDDGARVSEVKGRLVAGWCDDVSLNNGGREKESAATRTADDSRG